MWSHPQFLFLTIFFDAPKPSSDVQMLDIFKTDIGEIKIFDHHNPQEALLERRKKRTAAKQKSSAAEQNGFNNPPCSIRQLHSNCNSQQLLPPPRT